MSSKLLEEASKLEMMEGRQQVKTRTEKSPFNRINNQAAGDVGGFSGNFKGQQSSRGGELTISGAWHQCYSAATTYIRTFLFEK